MKWVCWLRLLMGFLDPPCKYADATFKQELTSYFVSFKCIIHNHSALSYLPYTINITLLRNFSKNNHQTHAEQEKREINMTRPKLCISWFSLKFQQNLSEYLDGFKNWSNYRCCLMSYCSITNTQHKCNQSL